jgi:bifunctional non-homologous end joining protein LigD
MTSPAIRQASLSFKEGGSDKVYYAQVSPEGGGFSVTFSYGRRGSALQHGTKTSGPVAEAEAVKIFDKLVKEKTGKGYRPVAGEASSPQVEALVAAKVDTGLRSQLPIEAEEGEAKRLLGDGLYLLQEKMDGHHKISKKVGDKITTANKKGQEVPTSSDLASALRSLKDDFVIDYEQIGDAFHVFDLLSLGHKDLRPVAYESRYRALETLLSPLPSGSPVKLVRTAFSTSEKRVLWDAIQAAKGEGVIFKVRSRPFSPGKEKDRAMLKFKFYATLSAIVDGATKGKRSISVSLVAAGSAERVPVGKCTVPANHEIPAEGAVVEIRYLYAYMGGSLFQPTYLGQRDDVDHQECSTQQLKFKPEGDGEDE